MELKVTSFLSSGQRIVCCSRKAKCRSLFAHIAIIKIELCITTTWFPLPFVAFQTVFLEFFTHL